MTDAKIIAQAAIIARLQEQGSITDAEMLDIRNSVAASLEAKRRYRHAYTAPTFEWKKPAPRR